MPGDRRWDSFLNQCNHDIYHRPEYLQVVAEQEGGTPLAFYAEIDGEACLIPLLRRSIPDTASIPVGWTDVTSPYGYASPLFTVQDDPDAIDRFLALLEQTARSLEIVSAFLRLHPLFPLPLQILAKHGELVRHGQTVWVDLALSLDVQSRQLRSGHKGDVRKMVALGFTVTMDDWGDYPGFIDMYRMTMQRLGASSFYYFSDAYFSRLRALLGPRLHFCSVRAPNGEAAAGGLFTVCDGIVQYHLSATGEHYMRHGPTKLMLNFVREWGTANGSMVLHLGGGVGGNEDSLFNFKSGFSPLRSDFYSYRLVFDHEKYSVLTMQAGQVMNPHHDLEDASFFPSYRRT